MDWKKEFAKRCEIERRDLRQLWRSCEETIEWSNEEEALDEWRKGGHQMFALAIAFEDEFSFLHYLEHECREIDQVLSGIDDSAWKSPQHKAIRFSIDAYDLSHFMENPHSWSCLFGTWHADLPVAERSHEAVEMEQLIVSKLAKSALLETLQEALYSFTRLWDELGTASFDIRDGISARIEALTSLLRNFGKLLPLVNECSIARMQNQLKCSSATSRTKQK